MGESEKQLENDEERNMATIKDIAARARRYGDDGFPRDQQPRIHQ